MQSGVAAKMNIDSGETTPKHLRVGVNSAMVDSAAVARLLIEKGVFTKNEYVEAVTVEMEREAKRYENYLTDHYGKPITLA